MSHGTDETAPGSTGPGDQVETDAEHELRERLLAGERPAFTEAMDRYAPRLLGLARRITCDRAAAEDIVQDVFLKLWTERERLRGRGGSVMPWLRRVCTNAALNWCDKRRVRQRQLDGPTEVIDDPLAAAARSESRARVEQALSRLPADRRAVLALRVFEEMSYDEIAQALSIAPGTVMSRLHRARQQVREQLAELDPARARAAETAREKSA